MARARPARAPRLRALACAIVCVGSFAPSLAAGQLPGPPGRLAPAAPQPAAPAPAPRAFLPPAGKVLTGLSGGSEPGFARQVGKRDAVYGYFTHFFGNYRHILDGVDAGGARGMIHLSTTYGYGIKPVITPAQIAGGRGDTYLLGLAAALAARGTPTYVRPLAEMNQANNPYCAFNADGSPRANTVAQLKQAFRRVVLILRGGPLALVNAKLAALRLPPVDGRAAGVLPAAPVAIAWVPQVAGSPDIPANSAQAYYPGDAYVDWVGTDFYSRYPNFAGLERFYGEHPGKPFLFGEWSIWGGDAPDFVRGLFAFANSHRRVAMMLYNQGLKPRGPFRLTHFPASLRAIRAALAAPRYIGAADGA